MTSVVSPRRPGEHIRVLWNGVPSKLREKVTNLKELPGLVSDNFPNFSKGGIQILYVEETHVVYGFIRGPPDTPLSHDVPLAYDCFGCNKIIGGPPRIDDGSTDPFIHSGRKGYSVCCSNCGSNFEKDGFF
ncbi:MAG TPA: hypothetical protein ENH99_02300 [Candidatus Pacearchaeota archaeon]|nr:hypothetical protein [Candidatus Pacearchaeota archaeon]